jgi:hypothetical protein
MSIEIETLQMSPECGELFGALSAAQNELKNPDKDKCVTVKTRTGPDYSYTYADIASVLEAARPILSKHGLCVSQWPMTERLAAKTEGGLDSYEIKVVTLLGHKSGQWMMAGLRWRPSDQSEKGAGGTITYLRRYAVQSVIGVAAEDDNDAPAEAPKVVKVEKPKDEWAEIKREFGELRTQLGDEKFYKVLGREKVENAKDIKSKAEATRIIGLLKMEAANG